MKLKALFFFLFVSYAVTAQNSDEFRIIPSVTDWIEEINNWPEDVYQQYQLEIHVDPVKDANYVFRPNLGENFSLTDSLTLLSVNKKVAVTDIRFDIRDRTFTPFVLKNIHFKENFEIYGLKNSRFSFTRCVFDKLHQMRLINSLFFLSYIECSFKDTYRLNNPLEPVQILFIKCEFDGPVHFSSNQSTPSIVLKNSNINQEDIEFSLQSKYNSISIDSTYTKKGVKLNGIDITNYFEITNSDIGGLEIDGANFPPNNTYLPFNQVSKKLSVYNYEQDQSYFGITDQDLENKEKYDRLIASYAKLLSVYKSRSESESYNACYVEMRKKQTAYSKFLYTKDKTFSNYTVYQLNVFMGVFSDYGTRPTKAIIFSLYVILAFALIYLFFPNSWDKHGKNRIVDRYTFFMKYMNKNAGIHEVYLDDKKSELLQYDEFKKVIETSGKTVPKFFSATALPLYKWAVSGTKISAAFLKRIDIMKGTWSDLPNHERIWKSILLIGAFLIALAYDIFIKMLNALMLSINTFTTLGFGEIPIKGLPRYLAIIQGFIGWFMLTIFSVSLISQLLN